jgi:chemotaxis protein methyltransferase WspC
MGRYKEVELLLAHRVGLDVHSIGERVLNRAVSLRVQTAFSGSYSAFLQALSPSGEGEEYRRLVESLVVPETWFFRDREAWELLFERIRDEWVGQPKRGALRALSAPCSTGEEVYSIAATLARAGLPPSRFALDGVDVSRSAIETARQAVYREHCFREPPPAWSERFFAREEGKRFRVSPELLSRVRLREANLLDKQALAGLGPYHVVFCKNLAIYLTTEARARLFEQVRNWLEPGGILFAGHSEVPLLQKAGFRTVPFVRSFALTRPSEAKSEVPSPPERTPLSPSPVSLLRRKRAVTPERREARSEAKVEATSESLVEKAQMLADQGELAAAKAICESLIKGNPLDARVYYLAGLIEQASDRGDVAGDLFGKAIYLDPAHYESLVQLSLIAERRGLTAKADQYRQRARRAKTQSGGQAR